MKVNINKIDLIKNKIYSSSILKKNIYIKSNKINKNNLYTTLMVDPDAPYPLTPTFKYYLHLLVINNKEIIVDYLPPDPPLDSPPHRYQIIILEQSNYINKKKMNTFNFHERPNFNLDNFITKNKLKIVDEFEFKSYSHEIV